MVIPLQGRFRSSRKRQSPATILAGVTEKDPADSLVWTAWVFQANTNATLSVTLGGLTVTSAIAISTAATLVKTLDGLTLSSTAIASSAFALSVTLDGLTLSATATNTPITTGDLSVTLGGLSCAATIALGPKPSAGAIVHRNGRALRYATRGHRLGA